jgi:capsule polysaccharide export protein KpsC/LpsZ
MYYCLETTFHTQHWMVGHRDFKDKTFFFAFGHRHARKRAKTFLQQIRLKHLGLSSGRFHSVRLFLELPLLSREVEYKPVAA